MLCVAQDTIDALRERCGKMTTSSSKSAEAGTLVMSCCDWNSKWVQQFHIASLFIIVHCFVFWYFPANPNIQKPHNMNEIWVAIQWTSYWTAKQWKKKTSADRCSRTADPAAAEKSGCKAEDTAVSCHKKIGPALKMYRITWLTWWNYSVLMNVYICLCIMSCIEGTCFIFSYSGTCRAQHEHFALLLYRCIPRKQRKLEPLFERWKTCCDVQSVWIRNIM